MEANEYRRLAKVEDFHWWYRATHELVDNVCKSLTFAKQKSDFKILDAGCGSGGLTKKLEKFGWVIGLDISPLALSLADRKRLALVRGSVNNLPFAKDEFDLITAISVLYHRKADDGAALQEFSRVLKPGGKLLLILPAFSWAYGAHDKAVHARRRYTLSEAADLVEASGFRVVEKRYIFSFLFPAFMIKRLLEKLSAGQRGVLDLAIMPSFLNNFLFWLCRVEWRLGEYIKFPCGSSLLVAAEKFSHKR